ncbi:hypothetical protein E2986_12568 [Frieseomelitta varia]|uniref:Uncharacterized protein n=1 Tax=Frieseomelitta varia TaxID=561572 RepID=A0A833RRQ8_9HYME|nr:hypothetical protein E2986_12568 [Frieseomelitta varia]
MILKKEEATPSGCIVERLKTNIRAERSSNGTLTRRRRTMVREKSRFYISGEQELCEQHGMRPCLGRLHPNGHAAGAK